MYAILVLWGLLLVLCGVVVDTKGLGLWGRFRLFNADLELACFVDQLNVFHNKVKDFEGSADSK